MVMSEVTSEEACTSWCLLKDTVCSCVEVVMSVEVNEVISG